MAITCDDCTTIVDRVHCEKHAVAKCECCQNATRRLLCEDCAEDEYGSDADDRDADDDDVIALLEQSVTSDDLQDLAAAIRREDRDEAEHLLDKIAARVPGWADRVSLGRYSRRAKAAA